MSIKGAIFDCDGTVLDSMQIWETVGIDYLKDRNIIVENNMVETFKTFSMHDAARFFREVYQITDPIEEIMCEINKRVEEFYFNEAKPKVDAKEYLEYLYLQNVPMCIATSTDEYLIKASLERNGMLHYFSKIFTCTEIGKGKQEPDVFDAALQFLGTKKEDTVIFEDSLYAIKTAKKAGYRVAGIYDVLEKPQEEIKQLADYYFVRYSEIKNLL